MLEDQFCSLGKVLQVIEVEGQELLNFDTAYWAYKGAQAKIVVYYPRNELKILWEEPFTYSRLSAGSFADCLPITNFADFLLETFPGFSRSFVARSVKINIPNQTCQYSFQAVSKIFIPEFSCALSRNAKQVMAEYRERQNVQIKKQSVYLKQSQVLGKDLWPKSSYLDQILRRFSMLQQPFTEKNNFKCNLHV